MPISAEIKVFVASLGNNFTWPKLPSCEVPDYTFINNLEEEVFDLVGTVLSDKARGTTSHIGLIMTAQEFVLVLGTTPLFTRSVHLGMVEYNLPTTCTTVQQHTERRCKHEHRLHVFEMEQMIGNQKKKHVMSCFGMDTLQTIYTVQHPKNALYMHCTCTVQAVN